MARTETGDGLFLASTLANGCFNSSKRLLHIVSNSFTNSKPGSSLASADLGEIAVNEAFLHVFHLSPVDTGGAGIVTVRQKLLLDGFGQFDRARRTEIGVGPNRLPLVGQEIVQHLLCLLLV